MNQNQQASILDDVVPASERPLRLLFVSHSFPPLDRPLANIGGMQRVATELYRFLNRRNDVELSELVLRSSARWNAIRTVFFYPKVWRTIHRKARRKEVDAILFSSLVTGSLMLLTTRGFRKWDAQTFTICHGDDVIKDSRIYRRILRRVFAALDGVFPVSRATRDQCLTRGANEAQLRVVPNGVDLTRFANPDELRIDGAELCKKLAIDGELSLPNDALLLCSAGRHVERKGFLWFIEHVMPELPMSVHYWLIGQGPQTETIRAAIRRHELSDRVRLLGRLTEDQLHKVYANSDLFIMPNVPMPGTMEGFGVVMLEAGICGTPSIAARLEGIQDVITDDVNGHLVESGDAAGYIRTINKYVDDRDALRELSRRTLEKSREFSWENVAEQYVAEIRSFL